jgi:hypothetical protein
MVVDFKRLQAYHLDDDAMDTKTHHSPTHENNDLDALLSQKLLVSMEIQ